MVLDAVAVAEPEGIVLRREIRALPLIVGSEGGRIYRSPPSMVAVATSRSKEGRPWTQLRAVPVKKMV